MSYPEKDANSHRDTAGACTRAAAGAFSSDPRLCRGGRTAAVDISSHGNSYTIAAFTLGTDEKGSTTIIISGSGFDKMHLRNGRIVVPVLCSFTTGREDYGWEQIQGEGDSLTFIFDTAKNSETISCYAEDKQEKIRIQSQVMRTACLAKPVGAIPIQGGKI